jgi:RNA polymerase sigma-70 factor (ECF subfamily)
LSQREFLDLIKENQNIIFKLVNVYASNGEDKKDIYQEILLQAWKAYPTFQGRSKFSTWLYRLSLNTIFTLKRKEEIIDFEEDLNSYEIKLSGLSTNENYEHLLQVIRRLNEIDRAIITMHLDGYENGEISDVLGITTNNVTVKLHRIKQKLSSLFNEL